MRTSSTGGDRVKKRDSNRWRHHETHPFHGFLGVSGFFFKNVSLVKELTDCRFPPPSRVTCIVCRIFHVNFHLQHSFFYYLFSIFLKSNFGLVMDNYLVSFSASRKILLRFLFGYTQNKIRGPPFWSLDLYYYVILVDVADGQLASFSWMLHRQ